MNKHGFTLIELLIASTLFLTAVLSFGYLLNNGKLTVASAARLNQAVYTLQAEAEKIKTYSFAQLLYLNGRTFAQGQGKTRVVSALADLVSIELELSWDPNKVPLKLHTLRSKY